MCCVQAGAQRRTRVSGQRQEPTPVLSINLVLLHNDLLLLHHDQGPRWSRLTGPPMHRRYLKMERPLLPLAARALLMTSTQVPRQTAAAPLLVVVRGFVVCARRP